MAQNKIFPANPLAGYLAAKTDIDTAIARVLASGIYINGGELAAFEKELTQYLGAAGAAGVANGTDAVEIGLRALGIGPGDKVVTVGNTVTATVAAIVATGATPVYVEIDPVTMLLDPAALATRLGKPDASSIKAVVPVHLYGLGCDMGPIMQLAQQHGLKVLEDCAQAHGSKVDGRTLGTWGDAAAFSFYPTKNLGALGDAGAVVSTDAAVVDRVRFLRQYGWRTRYVSDEHGRNSRLDEIQAAILRVRLTRLDEENAQRARIAAFYLQELAGCGLELPVTPPGRTHNWHQFVVRTEARDRLKVALESSGVLCGVLYPVPVYQQQAYKQDLHLPETERACTRVLSLPLHLGVDEAVARRVIGEVRAAL